MDEARDLKIPDHVHLETGPWAAPDALTPPRAYSRVE
jgi:hypothetical protein